MTTAFSPGPSHSWYHRCFALPGRHRPPSFTKYIIAPASGVLPLMVLDATSRAGSASAISEATLFGLSVMLPWMYWFVRCRTSIVIGWGTAAFTTGVLLLESSAVLHLSERFIAQGWTIITVLAILGGLVTNYRQRLQADYGWSSLNVDDRSAVVLPIGLTAMATWTWAPADAGTAARIASCTMGLAVVAAGTLNVVGGLKYGSVRLERYVARMDGQATRPIARCWHGMVVACLSTYSRSATSVLVGSCVVGFVFALSAFNLRGAAGELAIWVGLSVIVATPVLMQHFFAQQTARLSGSG